MKIFITTGGTGGHIFPALAVAKTFKAQNPSAKLSFIGNLGGLEERLAQQAGLDFVGLNAKKIVGASFLGKIKAIFYLKLSVLKCMALILKHKPQAVLGFGGYVSAPMMIAGFLLRVKTYLCEQNAVPGLANRLLAKISRKIFISYEKSSVFFPKNKTFLTGNPCRDEFFGISPLKPDAKLKILITGGSLGAGFLNAEVPKALALLKNQGHLVQVCHQTGSNKVEECKSQYQLNNIEANVVNFIEAMPDAFAKHNIIISRAGATVSAEIMASGMPSILVPYRFANGHQKHNALALSEKEAAIMLEESETFATKLSETIKDFITHPEKLIYLSKNAKYLATPDSALKITSFITQDLGS